MALKKTRCSCGGRTDLALDELSGGDAADLEPRLRDVPEERIHAGGRHRVELHEIEGLVLETVVCAP
jgi:hypothetical protein